ncbi:head completion/stabilization protein [Limnobaculum xujianqingii]|uniref:head completion/stabilization protein n=1 Tax=Limnobaculum xujianqingii TaxID=2738837 RepID=UPI001127F30D|nr:head completion/stabilization protein [Limnobaculum xujianqingii]
MSMIATEPVRPETETPNDGDSKVNSDSFWPEISLGELRKAMRLDGQVTTDRLMMRTIEAVAHVNDRLNEWRNNQEELGVTALSEVPASKINGESVKIWRYRNAVYSLTKALLIEGYRDIDTTREGEKHAEALATQIDTLWRDVNWAVSDIQGDSRGIAELV